MNQLHLIPDETTPTDPVTCLGQTFANDAARRAHFTELLRQKLQDPAFRATEGFPLGTDEAILALSDPPYYTACPNPWIEKFIAEWQGSRGAGEQGSEEAAVGRQDTPYHREPFAADVSEGKNDPIYNAHSYHTKVPHKAIMRYILHYTEPGDVVFDGFCGTGMTGVAAQLCGDRKAVEELGYRVDADGTILRQETGADGKKTWVAFSRLGARRTVLNDLSPAATFIAYNYNTPVDVAAFEREAKRILKEVEAELGWMYETWHPHCVDPNRMKAKANYIVWSDIYLCPSCLGEIVFWDAVMDPQTMQRKKEFKNTLICPHCSAVSSTRLPRRATISTYDDTLGNSVKLPKQVPVLVSYDFGKEKLFKKADAFDLELLGRIAENTTAKQTTWFPIEEMPYGLRASKDAYDLRGITHVHHFYTDRNLTVFSALWEKALSNRDIPSRLLFWLESVALGFTKLNRFFASSYSQVNRYMKGTLYVAPITAEVSPRYALAGKIKAISKLSFPVLGNAVVSTGSSSTRVVNKNSIDYVFVDPPFGRNLMYGELSYIWETWLRVRTQRECEAIVDETQSKLLSSYHEAMSKGFQEIYRALRPNGWMTVEFHNSENAVWNVIQESILGAGFVIADVRILDKQQVTMQQWVGTRVVDKDLVISAYKPSSGFEQRFLAESGTVQGVWDFVHQHLEQLPVTVQGETGLELIVERQDYLIFDRMVAFHIQRGITVPLSAAECYAGLRQRFPERDDMFFLPNQVAQFDKIRLAGNEIIQSGLIILDESTAIQWLRKLLRDKPQSFQDIHPQFLRELGGWQRHEKKLELRQLLEENFLRYDGAGLVPEQVHSYLSTNYKDLRNLPKDDEALRAKAKDRWYVPDPNKAVDLEKLRERHLLREFETYRESTQRKLKLFRLEAMRAGFKKAWQERDYETIISVAAKIPDDVLNEDPKLLMWVDQAQTRLGKES